MSVRVYRILALGVFFCLLFSVSVRSEEPSGGFWSLAPEIYAPEDGVGGAKQERLLLLALNGYFSTVDIDDNTALQVLCAMLPMLCAVTEEDFTAFCETNNADEETTRRAWYDAIAICMRADMRLNVPKEERRAQIHAILALFATPGGDQSARAQIREAISPSLIVTIAQEYPLPLRFVRDLLLNSDY